MCSLPLSHSTSASPFQRKSRTSPIPQCPQQGKLCWPCTGDVAPQGHGREAAAGHETLVGQQQPGKLLEMLITNQGLAGTLLAHDKP